MLGMERSPVASTRGDGDGILVFPVGVFGGVLRHETGGGAGEHDEYFDNAAELVVNKEKASVSMLQRQFRIGYNRAAWLMEELEDAGIVGPEDGSKPRKVLLNKVQLEAYRNGE